MSAIIDRQSDFVGIEIKEFDRDRHDCGIDLDNIDAPPAPGEIHRYDSDAQADAEHVINVGGITARQSGEHIRELRAAFFLDRIVGVLGEQIVQIKTMLAVLPIQNLKLAE